MMTKMFRGISRLHFLMKWVVMCILPHFKETNMMVTGAQPQLSFMVS